MIEAVKMVKKQILKVNTFGKLKIYNKTSEFPQEKKRSAQVELLLYFGLMVMLINPKEHLEI